MSIIGLDVGTTTSKGIVLSDQGEVLGKTYREYKVITKNETWLELDSNQVWESVKSILAELAFISNKDKIKAISVSAMGDTITPFDELLHPLYNSILAFDTRSITEAHTLGSRLGEEWIFKTTGMPLHPTYSACKILWIKNNLPKVFHKTSRFLCYEDFISMKLGSGAAISFSNAARTMFFDINKLTWNQKILNECSIQEDQLSKPCPSGTVIGNLSKKLAKELHLPEDVLIVSGGHDQPCGALGLGVVSEGTALDTTGTNEVILVPFNQPHLNEKMYTTKVCCYPHSYQGRYCSFSQILTAGAAYRWYKDTFFPLESIPSQDFNKNVYEMMESKMPDQSKNIFFIPHLSGSGNPTMNPNAKGCIYGLTLATDRYDIARAILEGITFELKINLELMESITGNNINEIKSFGGGARSDFWLQLKADITEKNIISSNTIEAGCLGAALLAGYGAGVFPSLDQGIEAVNHNLIYQKYRPNPKMHEVYSQKYTHYLLISQKINELYLQLE